MHTIDAPVNAKYTNEIPSDLSKKYSIIVCFTDNDKLNISLDVGSK